MPASQAPAAGLPLTQLNAPHTSNSIYTISNLAHFISEKIKKVYDMTPVFVCESP
jgi:hypothetical protein